MRPRVRNLIVLGAVALVAGGCSRLTSGADGAAGDVNGAADLLVGPVGNAREFASARLLYPLGVGYHWDWSIHVVNRITTTAGSLPPDTSSQPWSAEIVDSARVGARLYFIQSEYDPRLNLTPPPTGFLRREDRMGLYERDVPLDVMAEDETLAGPVDAGLAACVDRAAASAGQQVAFANAAARVTQKLSVIQLAWGPRRLRPTGADPGEITMLSFPLRPGVSWIVRDSPRFTRTVLGYELIRVPLGTLSAWRLRGDSELFGPNDRVYFWYSTLGLVRIRYHIESDAVDSTGAVIGRVASVGDQSLTGVRFGRPPIYPSLVAGTAR